MPLVTNLSRAGTYSATFKTLSLGFTDDGFKVSVQLHGEKLQFEEFGDALIDLVNRGASVMVEGVLKEWDAAGVIASLWGWDADYFGRLSCFGDMAVKDGYAGPLVLTADPCTGTDVWTFHKAFPDPELLSEINMNNKPRLIPVRFICFLSNVSAANRFFTIT